MYHGFVLIMSVTVILNIAVYLFLDPILHFLKVPAEVWDGMREYLLIILQEFLQHLFTTFLPACSGRWEIRLSHFGFWRCLPL